MPFVHSFSHMGSIEIGRYKKPAFVFVSVCFKTHEHTNTHTHSRNWSPLISFSFILFSSFNNKHFLLFLPFYLSIYFFFAIQFLTIILGDNCIKKKNSFFFNQYNLVCVCVCVDFNVLIHFFFISFDSQ